MSILSWRFCNFDVVWKISDFWSRGATWFFKLTKSLFPNSWCHQLFSKTFVLLITFYSYPSIIHVVVYVSISLEYSRSLGMFHLKRSFEMGNRCVISGKQLDFRGRSRWVKRCNWPRRIRDLWPSDLVMYPVSSCTFALETKAKVIYFAQIERLNVLYFFSY